ncbi:MAG: TadE family protein [Vampirovibrionales bacterium]|nr:TadE family protein [Vampirovibrionales bacterium]
MPNGVLKQKRLSSAQSGQNLVEFMLSLPFILIIFLFVVEAGRAWFFYEAVKMAANEGAQTAAVYQSPSIGRTAVIRKLQIAGIPPTGTPQVTQVPNQHAYQVSVTANFVPLFGAAHFPLAGNDLFTGFPISYTALKQYAVY